ncbi:response regulator [Solirubrobacter ginsenosidimutans]|uniref:histidine kinase n=1 Tax=Solirubrobacter ginsenosidimutans TaxID=490573 RepID=A0A9X3MV84_9ACTN|nr:PAS domain-containing sensor histidine kinase [Solirubrobacter ginsenosidimutans]MDA0161885.1 response regulator [Solirubrobacter ginsenosidimutans]
MTAAEDALRAIGAGEVDAFVVSDGGSDPRVFTLSTADRPYRIFVENMRDGAATLSSGGLILYANHRLAQLLSCPREVIVGSSLARFLAGGLPIAPKQLKGPDGLGATLELDLLDDNGVAVSVLVGASPLDVDGDQLTCLTFTDLRAQKAQEQEIARLSHAQAKQIADVRQEFALDLAESQKLEALGVLAGGIAHDFNNLLTVILGNAGVALSTLAPEARERGPLAQVELAATRCAELARQMLAYSGKGKFVVEILNLGEILSGQAELIEAAVSKTAVVAIEVAHDTPMVEADATQLRQVVLNLITNASEAIGDATGTISVRCGPIDADRAFLSDYDFAGQLPAGKYAFFEVADTGAGMDTETKEKIFDPFFTTKFTGRGLGLAAVQGIVRGHGGGMKVRSAPGQGTAFTLIIPASKKSASPAAPSAAPVIGHTIGTVLVAEDNDAIRRMTVMMLESIGLTVVSASDGAEALHLFEQRADEFAFVLLDLMMPGMSGEEVITELGRIGTATPIVLTSGYDAQELSQRFVGRGVAAFLQKPYQLSQLRATVLEVLTAQVPG